LTNERKEYIPAGSILAEVQQALSARTANGIEWITIVGSGEPTLHSRLGWLIRQVKELTPLPVAVITNGALLHMPDVRRQLASADAVLPSLDVGNARMYRKINRPWPKLTFDRLVEGLIAFRQEYSGSLWVELMLVRGLNDTEESLSEIASILRRVHPDQVHINVPTRPPAEAWVQAPDEGGLLRARHILGDIARVISPTGGRFGIDQTEDLENTILGIITRHPMREMDLVTGLNSWSPQQIKTMLIKLENSHKAQRVQRFGEWFWSAAGAYYSVRSEA
jgi:wyosine [tRNA(Phe)-imidazoG37] synthetase (radical SAM superfamily)